MQGATIRKAQPSDANQIARMQAELWPEQGVAGHLRELETMLRSGLYGTTPMSIVIAEDESGILTGFLEISLRSHADGCDPSHPVGYVEGWFVTEQNRGRGMGAALLCAAEDWAREQGCVEIASDVLIDNGPSLRAHETMGFEVVDRCVHLRKGI